MKSQLAQALLQSPKLRTSGKCCRQPVRSSAVPETVQAAERQPPVPHLQQWKVNPFSGKRDDLWAVSGSLTLTSWHQLGQSQLSPVGCHPEKTVCHVPTSSAPRPVQSIHGAAKYLLHLDPEAPVPHWPVNALSCQCSRTG